MACGKFSVAGGSQKIVPQAVKGPFPKTLHFLGENSPLQGKGKAISLSARNSLINLARRRLVN